MKTTGRPDQIICTFSANLSASTKPQIMQDLKDENTQVTVCTECAGLGINLRDIARAFQWKVSKHLALLKLLQRLGEAGRDPFCQAVAILFVNSKQILSNNIHTLEASPFKDLQMPVSC